MVMAGNESTPGALADDALSARLQWLRQRREALQEKLAQKNNELKNLCVEEAEITGVLPPEIPLEPGESPPAFRRKATFTYPQKLINKLKTADTEESELELERQVQLGIVEAALGIVNDPTESKATRRKHRLAYQQSQRRLQELETELNFLRQSRGKTHRQTSQLPTHAASYNAQSHSHVNVKHRTKKPRPPLDSTGNEALTAAKSAGRSVIQESGISLTPLRPEDKCVTYPGHGYEEQLIVPNLCNRHHSGTYPGVSPVDQQLNIKIVEHDHNDNHNVYIFPDQYRARTYSHGSGSSRGQRDHYQDTERTYRPYVPNTYTEDERQMRYRQLQQQQQHQHLQKQQQQLQDQAQTHRLQYGLVEYKYLDNADIARRSGQGHSYERDFRALSHYMPVTDYQAYYNKNNAQSQPLLRRSDRDSSSSSGKNVVLRAHTSASIETQLSAGYWARQDDEIVWVSMDEPATTADRFGSLDRRRRNAQYNSCIIANPDAQSRYRTVAVAGSTKGAPISSGCGSNVNNNNVIATSSHQHHSVHLLPLSEQPSMPAASTKMLLRTQSLGSVETWQSSNRSHDSHDGRDAVATESSYASRKSRQKEWYETSLDLGVTSAGLQDRGLILAAHKGAQYRSSPPPIRVKTNNVSNNESAKNDQILTSGTPMSPMNRNKRDKPEERLPPPLLPHARSYESPAMRPKVLEIPAESKPTSHDVCDDAIRAPLGSPQNCRTVVQAGKYQPYREVTKPFEMSDFYKYSTKFRKRSETITGQSQLGNDSPLQENRPVPECAAELNDLSSREPNSYGQTGGATASPVQRRIYQPVQRMTCQPYLASLR